jgi:hypothetical protein
MGVDGVDGCSVETRDTKVCTDFVDYYRQGELSVMTMHEHDGIR